MRVRLEQQLVHLPELALLRGGLGRLRGLLGVRMDLGDREVPEDKPDLRRVPVEHAVDVAERAPAVRALIVTVLQDRHRGIDRAADVVRWRHLRPGELVQDLAPPVSITREDQSKGRSMPAGLPDTALQLRSLVTEDATVRLSLESAPVPAPGPGEVIIQVEAAPINPSDLGLLLAGADVTAAVASGTEDRPVGTAPLPAAAARALRARVDQSLAVGNEGAGTVVAAGSMYSQYRCVDTVFCLELPEGATAAQGASSFVNPMTALGMIETLRLEG